MITVRGKLVAHPEPYLDLAVPSGAATVDVRIPVFAFKVHVPTHAPTVKLADDVYAKVLTAEMDACAEVILDATAYNAVKMTCDSDDVRIDIIVSADCKCHPVRMAYLREPDSISILPNIWRFHECSLCPPTLPKVA
jgi:hypothetical protein